MELDKNDFCAVFAGSLIAVRAGRRPFSITLYPHPKVYQDALSGNSTELVLESEGEQKLSLPHSSIEYIYADNVTEEGGLLIVRWWSTVPCWQLWESRPPPLFQKGHVRYAVPGLRNWFSGKTQCRKQMQTPFQLSCIVPLRPLPYRALGKPLWYVNANSGLTHACIFRTAYVGLALSINVLIQPDMIQL